MQFSALYGISVPERSINRTVSPSSLSLPLVSLSRVLLFQLSQSPAQLGVAYLIVPDSESHVRVLIDAVRAARERFRIRDTRAHREVVSRAERDERLIERRGDVRSTRPGQK